MDVISTSDSGNLQERNNRLSGRGGEEEEEEEEEEAGSHHAPPRPFHTRNRADAKDVGEA